MSIYAIGDLHLSLDNSKPMNVFGDNWKNHMEKIKDNWKKIIKDDDLVILPGDFSWAMNIKDMYLDFKFINDLPGIKVLIKGNHDYWWSTMKSMNEFIIKNNFTNIYFLNNNSFYYQGYSIIGTRGWNFKEEDNLEKMINREKCRLENSIIDCKKNNTNSKIICVLHYPPLIPGMLYNRNYGPYLEILKKYNIQKCLYGHLHGEAHLEAIEGKIDGIELKLVSSDYLNFIPYLVAKTGEETNEEK